MQGARINDIKFYKKSNSKTRKRKYPVATETEKHMFLSSLKEIEKDQKPIALSLFEGFSDSFHHKAPIPNKVKIPPKMSSFYLPEADAETVKERTEYMMTYNISSESINYIFNATKLQNQSLIWSDMRLGQITASVVHDVLHTNIDKPAKSLIKKICYKQPKIISAALTWGISNEGNALQCYHDLIKSEHVNLAIEKSGLLLNNEYHFLGASADAICKCNCHGKWLIEIKCPFKHRESKNISECLKDKIFCLDQDGNLKSNHKYMMQVQMQLYIYKVEKCDFVVWTPNFITNNEIKKDNKFVENIPKLVNFYRQNIASELIKRRLDVNTVNNKCVRKELYCYCRKSFDENLQMVGCNNVDCKYKWIHFTCAKLKRPPKGAWYCKDCKNGKK